MTMQTAKPQVGDLSGKSISFYLENGFVRIRGLLTPAEAGQFRQAALNLNQRLGSHSADKGTVAAFDQFVNVWKNDPVMRGLTLHPAIAQAAQLLSGVPLRLWHDHTLIKQPRRSSPTEFHQDQPYWPHRHSRHSLSCWIALGDVPVASGCMSFIPRQQARNDLRPQNLLDANDLFTLAPEMAWEERVAVPLRAGDCTFHHGLTPHQAGPNLGSEPRVAHVVIYMDKDTIYDPTVKANHVAAIDQALTPGLAITGPAFPLADEVIAGLVS